jgi:hypothetical protein
MSWVLDALQSWVDEQEAGLASNDIRISLTRGASGRDKESAWVDIDSPSRLVRLTVWDTGEAVLTVGDLATGGVVAEEQREITSELGLEDALRSALAWAEA